MNFREVGITEQIAIILLEMRALSARLSLLESASKGATPTAATVSAKPATVAATPTVKAAKKSDE